MTYIPAPATLLETQSWTEFKSVVVTQKGLSLMYFEFPEYYDIRAADAEKYRILVIKGTSDATDFETNYKATANQRYDVRVILVTEAGVPTISEVGGNAPPGAALVAGSDEAGILRTFIIEDGRLAVNPLVLFSELQSTSAPSDPLPTPIKPDSGPWHLLATTPIGKEGDTLVWTWGKE